MKSKRLPSCRNRVIGRNRDKKPCKNWLTQPGERNKGQSAFNKLNASSSEREKKPHRLNIGKKKIEKAKQYDQRRKEKAVSAPSKKTRTSRGLKGRSLTADERRIQTAIGTLPCIACHIHGQHSPVVSLHHIFGRTAENAHKYVLPLCKWHHQYAAPAEVREQYPWLVPVHADGKIGGKADFIRHNADEMALYQMAIEMIN
ncbi:Ref family recombination enhancement nuclease [Escherichia coli]